MRKSVGERIIEGLTEFADALESGEPLDQQFMCHKVQMDLTPRRYRPKQVRATRALLGASQALFARFLGVSVQTVRAWEQGTNVPSGMAARFMDEIHFDPRHWIARFRKSAVRRGAARVGKRAHASRRRGSPARPRHVARSTRPSAAARQRLV